MQCGRLLRIARSGAPCARRGPARGAHTYIGAHTRLREFTQAFLHDKSARYSRKCEIFVW